MPCRIDRAFHFKEKKDMLFGEETWAMTECPRHKIEYIGCFCPECFSRPKHLKLEKYAGGECVSVTIVPHRELSKEMQELFDRWKNSSSL